MGKEMSCKQPSGSLGSQFLTMASYLAISDFYSIGEEKRYHSSTDTLSPLDQQSAKEEDEQNEAEKTRMERSLSRSSPDKVHQDIVSSKGPFAFKSAAAGAKKRKRATASLDLDPDLLPLTSEAQKLREPPPAKMTRGKAHDDFRPRSSDDYFSSVPTPSIPLPREHSTQARASPERVPSPLQLSSLASVTGTNATRNKQVNILAMIEYVSNSTVKPTTAPLKRDVRIVDSSTDKKVTLSVFVDPVNFVPKKYDIMLFRNLTTHDFSGGNLNAYPKKCKGKEWCILNPYHAEECDMKSMEEFRANYRKTKAQEPKSQTMRN